MNGRGNFNDTKPRSCSAPTLGTQAQVEPNHQAWPGRSSSSGPAPNKPSLSWGRPSMPSLSLAYETMSSNMNWSPIKPSQVECLPSLVYIRIWVCLAISSALAQILKTDYYSQQLIPDINRSKKKKLIPTFYQWIQENNKLVSTVVRKQWRYLGKQFPCIWRVTLW